MAYSHEVEHSKRSKISIFFGATGLVLLPLGALGTKFGLWNHSIGIIMVMLAFLSSLVPVSLFLGFGWHPGYRSERPALLAGMAMGLVPLLLAIYLFGTSGDAPIIHDVSTDTSRPPEFQTIVDLREANHNSLQWSEEVAVQQRLAYPEITSIESSLSAEQAFDRSLQLASELGWEIVDSDSRDNYIEAVSTTYWFGFKDDVVIRIEATSTGSVIDLRSVSRVGQGDLGTNAKRIGMFITEFTP